MIPKSIAEIELADLQSLIDNEVREGKTIDYKRELPGDTAGGKKEFLADVSSFANAGGGDLIFGLDEEQGAPVRIPGVLIENVDQLTLRLENIIRDGLEPRLPSVEMKMVSTEESRGVLVIRVRKSWNSPHRVSFRNDAKFYSRNSAGKYQLDVAELRSAFILSESVAERMREFRADRIAKIYAYETPVPIEEGARVILHLLPLSAFSSGSLIDVPANQERLRNLQPIGGDGRSHRLNLDGIITFTGNHQRLSEAYTQFYRNGAMEAVLVIGPSSVNGQLIIPSQAYEKNIIEVLPAYLNELRLLDVEIPNYIFMTIIGVSSYTLGVHSEIFQQHGSGTVDRDALILPEMVIDSYEELKPANILKPLFDMVWNAFGYDRSFNYDDQGNWVGQA